MSSRATSARAATAPAANSAAASPSSDEVSVRTEVSDPTRESMVPRSSRNACPRPPDDVGPAVIGPSDPCTCLPPAPTSGPAPPSASAPAPKGAEKEAASPSPPASVLKSGVTLALVGGTKATPRRPLVVKNEGAGAVAESLRTLRLVRLLLSGTELAALRRRGTPRL